MKGTTFSGGLGFKFSHPAVASINVFFYHSSQGLGQCFGDVADS